MGWAENFFAAINNLNFGALNNWGASLVNSTSTPLSQVDKANHRASAPGANTNPLGNIELNLSSKWGYRPNKGDSDYHCGCDVGVPVGTPVFAIRSGTVGTVSGSASDKKLRGLYIRVKNDDSTEFAAYIVQHLSKALVNQGDHVDQGQLIAYSGDSGTGGAHFHWEIHNSWPTVWNRNGLGTSKDPMSITYTNLDGNEMAAAVQDAGSNASSGDSSGTEQKYNHIEETNQYFTVYDDDTSHKAVDKYKVAFKKWDGQTWDITDVCANVSFKESTSDVCTQLSVTIISNKYDKYLKQLNPETGDKISMTNTATGKLIFTGMVIDISRSGLTGVTSINAIDDGRKLTMNNIITQFQNQPCYDVISTCANKAGVKTISCFPFVSTWSGTFSGKASDMINTALEQIAQENGVKYFMRVINDTIVVKSYSNNVITPYYKAADNIQAAPCFANASEYNYSEDAKEVATRIQVAENQNGVNIVVAEAQSEEAIKRWGNTQQIVMRDSGDSSSADDKAIYNLYYGSNSKPIMTYSVSAPGSDAVVAGCLIKMYLDGEPTKFWVTDVTHDYYPTHTMKMTLEKYQEPLDIATLRALHTVSEQGAQSEEESDDENTED